MEPYASVSHQAVTILNLKETVSAGGAKGNSGVVVCARHIAMMMLKGLSVGLLECVEAAASASRRCLSGPSILSEGLTSKTRTNAARARHTHQWQLVQQQMSLPNPTLTY